MAGGVPAELTRLSATEAVVLLEQGEVSPLEMVHAAEARIRDVEPSLNALPTTCFERARSHAQALMQGERSEASGLPGWLGGLIDLEIESFLNAYPGVNTSAVIEVPHDVWGEVGLAFVVPEQV